MTVPDQGVPDQGVPDQGVPGRAANLLGALALAITDRMAATVAGPESGGAGAAGSGSVTAAAALCALHHFLDRPTLDQLRRVLGLTSSGTVRLVDRLAAAGLVVRGPGADGRSRSVTLTATGRAAAARVSADRTAALRDLLAGLSTSDLETLHALLGQVMAELVRGKEGGSWVCRLCDLAACGRAAGHCPTANAAAARYGLPAPGDGTGSG